MWSTLLNNSTVITVITLVTDSYHCHHCHQPPLSNNHITLSLSLQSACVVDRRVMIAPMIGRVMICSPRGGLLPLHLVRLGAGVGGAYDRSVHTAGEGPQLQLGQLYLLGGSAERERQPPADQRAETQQ